MSFKVLKLNVFTSSLSASVIKCFINYFTLFLSQPPWGCAPVLTVWFLHRSTARRNGCWIVSCVLTMLGNMEPTASMRVRWPCWDDPGLGLSSRYSFLHSLHAREVSVLLFSNPDCVRHGLCLWPTCRHFSVLRNTSGFSTQVYLFNLSCCTSGNVGPREETPSEIQWNSGWEQSPSHSALTFLEHCWVCIRFGPAFARCWKTSDVGCNALSLPQVPPPPCWVRNGPWPALWLWRRVFQNITTAR